MADDEMYLENLQEFVVQEERLVTYKWLSRTLSVNVNQAKQMLYAFVQHQQKDKNANSLSIVYIIGGIIKTGSGLVQKYLFAHENDLEDIKLCYDKLTSLHIYSVQKSNPKDSNVLYMADYELQKENLDCPNRWSNITCKLATKRASEIPNKDEDNDKENKEKEKTGSSEVHKPVNSNPKVQLKSGPSTSKKTTKSKAKSSMKKGDVASFFARQVSSNKVEAQKSNNVKEREDQSPKNDETKTNDENTLKNDQVGKSGSKSKEEIKEEKETEPTATDKDPKCKTETVDKGESSNSTKKPSPTQAEKTKKQTKRQKEKDEEKPKKKGAKRNKSKTSAQEEKEGNDEENKQKRKKRKRVKNFSDSEEEADFADLKQSDSSAGSTPIPDQQPTLETVKKTESIVPLKVRRRKKVMKSKTSVNDEGYMVTEKVYESESTDGSDVEMKEIRAPDKKVENNAAEKEKTAPAKKKPANKATKQSSLTNFFKKS